MKKIVYLVPFVIALMFIFINELTVFTRIAFAIVGLFSLSIAICETIKFKCKKSDFNY